jgi:menaquinol-cytochrome c reductase iron-sulfur subunit
MTRRKFYEQAIYVFNAVIGAALTIPALGYLLVPRDSGQGEDSWTDAGSLDSLPLGRPVELSLHRERRDGWKKTLEKTTAWVLRREQGVVAYGPQCTHLGCGYRWTEDEEFVCPCHDTGFTIDGEVSRGPAPRPLDRYDVRIEGGRIWLGEIREADQA